ncbi:MAG: rhomboid family intramembrane serine protease [Planctomycetota bacterium]|nr:rhomboid family intramembrane serine protease [Planctomycetota bacterium]
MFPWKTDAPIYHLPIVTIALIVLNSLIFFGVSLDDVGSSWALAFGDGLHPLQWVSNIFLHADYMHLFGNMVFLWTFGLVVEGKVGWWKFLLIYLGLGIIESAATQICMLNAAPSEAIGASGAIFGLVAIAMIWAPSNNMSVVMFFALRLFFFDISIMVLAMTYIGMELVMATMKGYSMSSEMLHLAGAAPGLVVGIVMLKMNLVDCENWDIFTVLRGREGETIEPEKPIPTAAQITEQTNLKQSRRQAAVAHFKEHMRLGNAMAALQLNENMSRKDNQWELSQPQRLALIQLLHKQQLWKESIPIMAKFLDMSPDAEVRVRLRMAQILITEEQQPARALRLLSKIPAGSLVGDMERTRQKIEYHARKLQEEGVVEFETRE